MVKKQKADETDTPASDPTEVALEANAPAETDDSVTLSNVDHDPSDPQPGPDENPALVDDPVTEQEPLADDVKRDGRRKDQRVPADERPAVADGGDLGEPVAYADDETDVVVVTEETQDPHLPSSPLAPPPLFENADDNEAHADVTPQSAVTETGALETPRWVDEVTAPKVGNQRVQTTEQDQASPLPNSPAPENPAVAGLAQIRPDAVEPRGRRNTVDERNSLAYQYFLSDGEAEQILLRGLEPNSPEENRMAAELKGARRPNHPLTIAEKRRDDRLAEEARLDALTKENGRG